MVRVTVRADILVGGDSEGRPIGPLDRVALLAVTTLESARGALAVADSRSGEEVAQERLGAPRRDALDGALQ
jgi:hypothetical protein